MREILFRGRRRDNGAWIYGDLRHWHNGELAIVGLTNTTDSIAGHEVDPATVGQFTGLTDKNGVKIFEGDILKDSLGWVCTVKWDDCNGRFLGHHEKPRGNTYICYVGREPAQAVIGNIHDNPELLGGAE